MDAKKPLHSSRWLALEEKWRTYWERHGFFTSQVNLDKSSYTVVMPPPNVTGILHMGHMLNNTIQDVLVRHARMQGKEACWIPGTDHASIATEAQVVARLQAQGIDKAKIGREAFLKHAWAWKEEYEAIMVTQLKRLGISCDWSRKQFTMDPIPSQAVEEAFIRLYKKGYIYRGTRMIHWDPKGKTALADEEVIYRDVDASLYFVRYPLESVADNGTKEITIATTRPETMLGDTAICVHPDDERYKALHGKYVYVPLIDRKIPIIVDDYVDIGFGTGALKVTPAHDMNDYALGIKHKLEMIHIFTQDGCIAPEGKRYVGEDRMSARFQMVKDLRAGGFLQEQRPYRHKVGFSERTHVPVEPRISTQWFVRMQKLSQPAKRAVKEGIIQFHPSKFTNMYHAWMDNIKDWCISRQLWWGHRIPVFYLPDGSHVVARSLEEAVEEARQLKSDPTLEASDLRQDEDVLDTWFSSWLWPFSTLDGMEHPDNEQMRYYYPSDDLVTAPEIIFFWVARMIMAGYAFTGKPPFKHVYFTGIVRDKKRQKMSKSLGNSPDPIDLMEQYGTDGVRAGMLFAAPAGNDLLFEEKLCLQGAQFSHKIMHALALCQSWHCYEEEPAQEEQVAMAWFESRFQQALAQINASFASFRISEALITLYKLIKEDFCAHYLEMIKPLGTSKQIAQATYLETIAFFEDLMLLLHPFMPFVSEEVWHQLMPREEGASLAIAAWPQATTCDQGILHDAEKAFELLTKVRKCCAQSPPKGAPLHLYCSSALPQWVDRFHRYLKKTAKLITIEGNQPLPLSCYGLVVGGETFWLSHTVGIQLTQGTDPAKEMERLKKFLIAIEAKLNNKHFISHAPQALVDREKQKQQDTRNKIAALERLKTC